MDGDTPLPTRPDSFVPRDLDGRYIVKEDATGCLKQDWCNNARDVIFHLDAYKWTPSVYKEWKKVFRKELDFLASLGYNHVWSCVKEWDTKALKFNKMFGFTDAFTQDGRTYLIRSVSNVQQ